MKILFLDFDGVIFTMGGCIYHRWVTGRENHPKYELDPVAMALLEYLLKKHEDLYIVVSSVWRCSHTVEELRTILGSKIGPRVIGSTPRLHSRHRGEEIDYWLKHTEEIVSDFIILDDDADMYPHLDRLFLTDSHNGFNARDYVDVETYLSSDPKTAKRMRFKKKVKFTLLVGYWKIRSWFRRLGWKIKRRGF